MILFGFEWIERRYLAGSPTKNEGQLVVSGFFDLADFHLYI